MNRKGVIVCVDDEPSVLDTLKDQLTEHFCETHEIVTAKSGDEALQLINTIEGEDEIIEMVITDQVMPGMQGDQLLEKVHEKMPDTIKILLTGQAGLDATIRAVNRGGLNRYIEKPWNINTLKDDISGLIAKFRENLHNRYLLNNLERRINEVGGSA